MDHEEELTGHQIFPKQQKTKEFNYYFPNRPGLLRFAYVFEM